jgi:hypothetical protein
MSKIHIKEFPIDGNLVEIRIVGILDRESTKIIESMCKRYFKRNIKVILQLAQLQHTSREGKDFLKKIHGKVRFVDPPPFLQLGTGS